MISFSMTDEQRMLQETAHKFAEQEIRPKAEHHDRTGELPREILLPRQLRSGGELARDDQLLDLGDRLIGQRCCHALFPAGAVVGLSTFAKR